MNVASAGHETRPRNHALIDRAFERGVDIVQRARADRAGESGAQQQLGVFGGDQREHRRRMLQVDMVDALILS